MARKKVQPEHSPTPEEDSAESELQQVDGDSDGEDYEKQRLANIAKNEALLRELGVTGGLSGRASRKTQHLGGTNKPQPKPKPRQRRKTTPPPAVDRPRRISSRLKGIEADSDALKRKYEEEAEALRVEQEAAKRARHEDHKLQELLTGRNEAEIKGKAQSLAAALAAEQSGRKNARALANKDAKPETASKAELRKVIDKMELRSADKVVDKRIYTMVVHPRADSERGDLVFVGDKEGCIGVWEPLAPSSEPAGEDDDGAAEDGSELPSGSSWRLQAHGKSPVTCLKLDPTSDRTLYSSSYDSSIRALDLDKGVSAEVWAGQDDVLLSVFDVLPGLVAAERNLWVADHRGGLISIDKRARRTRSQRWQVCEKKIGGMSVNPLRPRCIAVASLDQHIRLFDVRAMRSMPTEEIAPYSVRHVDFDALEKTTKAAQIGEHQARLACTSVDFSPRGDNLVGVSYDDVVKVWDLHPSWLAKGDEATKRNQKVKIEPRVARAPAPKPNGKQAVAEDLGNLRQTRRSASGRPAPVKRESSGLMRWFTSKEGPKSESEEGDQTDESEEEVITPGQAAKKTRPPALEDDDDEWAARADAPSKPSDVLQSPHIIPHNNQTGKWLTLFRARWNTNAEAEPHFSMGSMKREAEIWASDGTLLRSLYDGDHVTAVPAVTAMHPTRLGRLATGNGSGRCHFWAPLDE